MFNTFVGAGAVGAGAASRYGSGSDQKMRLLAAPAPQHWCCCLLSVLEPVPVRHNVEEKYRYLRLLPVFIYIIHFLLL
jgi:hypothetical protein